MAIKKEKKVEIVKSLADKVSKADSAVLVRFTKLQVKDATNLRKTLRDKGVSFAVSKKTLLKRALSDLKIGGEMPSLDGQTAIAFAKDALEPAKSIAEMKKKFAENIFVLGGIFEGKFISASEVLELSKIPGREVLLSQLLNVMNGPVQGFVSTLNEVARSFVATLNAVAKAKQA